MEHNFLFASFCCLSERYREESFCRCCRLAVFFSNLLNIKVASITHSHDNSHRNSSFIDIGRRSSSSCGATISPQTDHRSTPDGGVTGIEQHLPYCIIKFSYNSTSRRRESTSIHHNEAKRNECLAEGQPEVGGNVETDFFHLNQLERVSYKRYHLFNVYGMMVFLCSLYGCVTKMTARTGKEML